MYLIVTASSDAYIQNKIIGENHPCYTVAEIGGAFHNIDQAKRLIDSAES